MSRDMVVFVAVVSMVGAYGCYTLGREKGEDAARKSCPPQRGVILKNITEEKGQVRCLYSSTPAVRRSESARRAAL
jgi:hypothetical protein